MAEARNRWLRGIALVLLLAAAALFCTGCGGAGNARLSATVEDAVYTGAELKPTLSVTCGGKQLVFGQDFTTEWHDNVDAGEATVTVTGTGSYTGSTIAGFTIAPADVADLALDMPAVTYRGEPIEPAFTLSTSERALVKGEDFELEAPEVVDAGTHELEITGTGNFTGSRTLEFEVQPKPLDDAKLSSIDDVTYSPDPAKPKVTVKCGGKKLKKGRDYKLSYKGNDAAGTAQAIVKGTGNYSGTRKASFTIEPKSLKDLDIAPIATQAFNGVAVEPEVVVTDGDYTLEPDVDYMVVYLSNTSRGEAQAIVKGKGNYANSKAVDFLIDSAGDAIARAACRVAYSRGVHYGGGTNGAHPGTSLWRGVYAQVCPGSPWIRSCIAAVKGIVRWSGYDPSFPMPNAYPSKSYENYLNAHADKWAILGTWDGNMDSLEPGDILTSQRNGVIGGNTEKDHSFIYVGPDIPQEVYVQYLQGTDADLGAPTEGSVFVCSHGGGGLSSSRSSAPCICDSGFALAYKKSYVVIRPIGAL